MPYTPFPNHQWHSNFRALDGPSNVPPNNETCNEEPVLRELWKTVIGVFSALDDILNLAQDNGTLPELRE